ncbi:MAG: sigma-54 dependent transcriptional regulator [Abditibacteriales bacterium]|nr:sigma-54 dependent transcriptional regulator [Abditibacteriales bacterium]MDW8367064.1 sigma-54 dependent transcriptional regulator [Abditibacteriales bacterium]
MAAILIVDDQASSRLTLSMLLKKQGHQLGQAASAQEAIEKLAQDVYDAVIADLRMENPNSGIEVLKAAQRLTPSPAVIILTAYGSVESAVEAMKLGAADYVQKPFAPDELLVKLDRALEWQRKDAELVRLRRAQDKLYGFENIVAKSKGMLEVLDLVRRVAPSDATVLIEGETGTGKELIARALHQHSPRHRAPFLPINCGALPETILESELFGHVKGAFTDAKTNKKGLFEEADGGTIFLDEISETSPSTQVKLLRVLQDGEVRRVGSNTPIQVDVRIIAATNRLLKQHVAEGKFREDLYYRLQVIPIRIPPLRERKEDILPLAEHFLRMYNAKNNRDIKGLSREAQKLLLTYDWPGNVRELENAIERAVILCTGKEITPDDFLGLIGGDGGQGKKARR